VPGLGIFNSLWRNQFCRGERERVAYADGILLRVCHSRQRPTSPRGQLTSLRIERNSAMRKRILFLSQCLPFPPHSGVTNRTYHILRELQREFDVALVAFSRRNHQPDSASRAAAAAELRLVVSDVREATVIGSEWSMAVKLRNHLSSLLTGKPYIFYDYSDQNFGQALREELNLARPDVVHIDSMDLYRWLPFLPAVPIACTHHSVESELLRLRADRIRHVAVRAYMHHQANLVERIERQLCSRFDINVMTSERDAERLRAVARDARTSVIPNGVDTDYFCPTSPEEHVPGRVAFLGPTYMFPNRDAVDFFLAEVWSSVRERCPESTFHLIGKNSVEEKQRFESHPGVRCEGYVPDIRPSFAETECSVVPLRIGGGTRLKILDAWAMGKAVVSTSVGCEGLETVDSRNILIRDDPTDFADAVVQVLRNQDLREHLGHEARKTAEERYGWRVVGRKLVASYQELLTRVAS
jgi:glycosyltransferase involved in cell wall biosynthesis